MAISPATLRRRTFIASLAAVTSLGAYVHRASANEADLAALDGIIDAAMGAHDWDGVGVLVCTADRVLYQKSFGDQTAESRRLLASATKLASATLVMTLVDDGLIGLDDTIGRFIPAFGPNRRGITIRQLLSQTHGLPGNHDSIALPQRDNGLTLEESVDAIAREDTLDFAPGSKHLYQPAVSYHIGGRIAEIVTGESWASLVETRLKTPLRMPSFSYGDTPNPRIGGGGLVNLADYGRLVQMHLGDGSFEGRQVLSEAMTREMRSDQLNGVEFTPSRSQPEGLGYGLSWWFDRFNEDGSPGLMAVPGAFGSTPWLDTRLGVGGMLLFQERVRELPAIQRFYLSLARDVDRLIG